jgi:hypothetical protein
MNRNTKLWPLALLLLALLLPAGAWAQGIRQPVAQLNLWNRGECTRINDYSFSVPDTARNVGIYRAGVPMRYGDTYGTWRYGLITSAVDAGATLSVSMAGGKMSADYDGFCEYGLSALMRYDTIVVPGTFADASDATLLLHDLKMIVPEHKGTAAYLLRACFKSISDDTGASNPTVGVVINSQPLGTPTVTNSGWACSGAGGYEAVYDIQSGETWEISVSAVGTNDDSTDLTVQLAWLQEI